MASKLLQMQKVAVRTQTFSKANLWFKLVWMVASSRSSIIERN
ncbi:hypothetical protein YQE_12647, partial [Dendroctonus ponderosae]